LDERRALTAFVTPLGVLGGSWAPCPAAVRRSGVAGLSRGNL